LVSPLVCSSDTALESGLLGVESDIAITRCWDQCLNTGLDWTPA
jgi:hypothetical protein